MDPTTLTALYHRLCLQRHLLPSDLVHFHETGTVSLQGDFSAAQLQCLADTLTVATLMESLGYQRPPDDPPPQGAC